MPEDLQHWHPAKTPDSRTLEVQYTRLEKLDPARHSDELWLAFQGPDSDPALWDYLPYGPFPEREAFDAWLQNNAATSGSAINCGSAISSITGAVCSGR